MLPTTPDTPRVAIYARFSSKLQKPTSIDDQIRLCRQRAEARGHVVVRVHADRSTTGTTRFSRPGLRDILQDAERGAIDIVYAEALDRISRDQEDMPGIYKRLKYWNVRLFTLEEGEIQPIHICVGGLMNHAYIENLANKTRRGQIGAVHAGRIPGGLSYGYRIANRIDAAGQPLRGLRDIDPRQASVIRRIYRLYADGISAREIAAILNRAREPGPRGRPWGQATINGHRIRRNGILNNELYRGRLVYGRQTFIRNPDTGKRQARPVPPDEWVVKDLPELRIVDDPLWDLVQSRRQAGQDRRHSKSHKTPLPLTGVLRCGQCGSPMTIVSKRRYGCHAHREKGTCSNPRGFSATRLENEACTLLSLHILRHPDLNHLINAAAEEAHSRRRSLVADIAERERSICLLIDSIETGRASQAAHRRVLELEREIATHQIDLRTLPQVPDTTPDRIAARIQQRLVRLKTIITKDPPDRDLRRFALLAVSRLIERIDLSPRPGRGNVELTLHPRPDALVAFALADKWRFDATEDPVPP